jgi:hypothetical protein
MAQSWLAWSQDVTNDETPTVPDPPDMLGHFRRAVWVAFGADPIDLIEW